ncbi:P-loop NTPase fold protein [Larkinella insperata]|uniref:P-loop NTPase fold protein n=1 Tax=Larkinella insperata TaxID=332158 RepID=A0ABW3QK98_9BACT|nr:P-loop NTPase fold protein [Larkinella insperata]
MISHIDVESPEILFENHFNESSNKRILFSGEFGCGKTYFLNHFFEARKENINTFWLSPVKYSIGQNEDIIEYIKINIALQLLKRPEILPIVKEKYDEDLFIFEYIKNKPLEIVKLLVSCVEALGVTTGPVEKVLDTLKNYGEYSEKLKDNLQNEEQSITKYLKQIVNIKGSIFEDDIISQSIRAILHRCKAENRQNILIIDDFDRLDPEHIFRILNILSVHNDYFETNNKFDFDKIIIVCDYHNIRKIYQYKYGPEVDYKGYINKFYSNDIFHFTNEGAISYYCENQLADVLSFKHDACKKTLGLLLSQFVKHKIITMRQIVKQNIGISFKSFSFGPYTCTIPSGWFMDPPGDFFKRTNVYSFEPSKVQFFFQTNDFPFLQIIKSLTIIFGSYDNLMEAIDRIKKESAPIDPPTTIILIKAIMPLYHLICNDQNHNDLVYRIEADPRGNGKWIGFPTNNFLSLDYIVPTGWNNRNPYDPSLSYFHNIIDELNKWGSAEESTASDYKILFHQLETILDFLNKKNFLHPLGIS